jgi:hypothetical protein
MRQDVTALRDFGAGRLVLDRCDQQTRVQNSARSRATIDVRAGLTGLRLDPAAHGLRNTRRLT